MLIRTLILGLITFLLLPFPQAESLIYYPTQKQYAQKIVRKTWEINQEKGVYRATAFHTQVQPCLLVESFRLGKSPRIQLSEFVCYAYWGDQRLNFERIREVKYDDLRLKKNKLTYKVRFVTRQGPQQLSCEINHLDKNHIRPRCHSML